MCVSHDTITNGAAPSGVVVSVSLVVTVTEPLLTCSPRD
jgi:hypothetical protein